MNPVDNIVDISNCEDNSHFKVSTLKTSLAVGWDGGRGAVPIPEALATTCAAMALREVGASSPPAPPPLMGGDG